MTVQPIERIDRRVPLVVVLGVLVLFALEAIWLVGAAQANHDLEKENLTVAETTQQMRARTAELQANENRIRALYTRLNDAIFKSVPARGSGRFPAPGRRPAVRQNNLPPIIQAFGDAGCQVVSSPNTEGDLSLSFAIGSNALEFHRLVPLLTEQENSNAFLVIDKLLLNRPNETSPFSLQPVALQSRLMVHLLSIQ
jgi:hypothetical protein